MALLRRAVLAPASALSRCRPGTPLTVARALSVSGAAVARHSSGTVPSRRPAPGASALVPRVGCRGASTSSAMAADSSNMYTASFAFFEAIWEAGITHCFVNLGSDHPSIIEAMVKGKREAGGRFPRIITCPNEVAMAAAAAARPRVAWPRCTR